MQSIQIKHLGPIVNTGKIELNRMNILIGEQASGKSTFCKAVYCFRNYRRITFFYLYERYIYATHNKSFIHRSLETNFIRNFLSILGPMSDLSKDLEVTFWYTDENFIRVCMEVENDHKKRLHFMYSDTMEQGIQSLIRITDLEKRREQRSSEESKIASDVRENQILQMIDQKTTEVFGDDMETYYIPAGRAMISLLSSQKTRLDYSSMDPVNVQYMQEIERLQQLYTDGVSHAADRYRDENRDFEPNEMVKWITTGIQGEYFCKDGQEIFVPETAKTERVPIANISSGQQEVLWIYQQLYAMMLQKEKAFVIIEEPESHLYPTMQKDILDFIVAYHHITGGYVIVTTHSPYLLTETNNLCYAGRLRKKSKNNANRVIEIMGKYGYLDEEQLNALRFNKKKGQLENLMQDHEIQADRIDEVSDEIDRAYTKLFDLDESEA